MGEQVLLRWQPIEWLAVVDVVGDPVAGQTALLMVVRTAMRRAVLS